MDLDLQEELFLSIEFVDLERFWNIPFMVVKEIN